MITSPLTELGMNAIAPEAFFNIALQSSLGALLATLQFEKKIDPNKGAAIGLSLLFLLNYDSVLLGFIPRPELPAFKDFFVVCPPFAVVYFGLVVVTILQATWKRAQLSE